MHIAFNKMIFVLLRYNYYLMINLLLLSCANYQLESKDNPFARFGVDSLAIPMFVNRAPYPQLGPIFTQKMIEMLGEFNHLQIFAGEHPRAEALLLGIITPRSEKLMENSIVTGQIFTASGLKDSIGARQDFYLPSSIRHDLNLTLVLIKNGKEMFRHTIEVQTSQNLVLMNSKGTDDSGVVNFTHNLGNQQMLFAQSATEAMGKFRELVLYAF